MKLQIIFFIVFSLLYQFSFSQTKYEKESRVKRSEVPERAKAFIDSCFAQKNIKWIKETNLKGFSFEAKTKKQPETFSIEFDTIGKIQDVEFDIKYQELPSNIINTITQNIENEFLKFKIRKTQIQWIGKNQVLIELIKTKKSDILHTTNYEIVLKGKTKEFEAYFELLFDFKGKLLQKNKIIHDNSDNLVFD